MLDLRLIKISSGQNEKSKSIVSGVEGYQLRLVALKFDDYAIFASQAC